MSQEMNAKEVLENQEMEVDAENTDADNIEIKEESKSNSNKKGKDKKEIEKLRDEISAQREQYLRVLAEYDNFRKRTQAEKSGLYNQAVADTVSIMLPVVDSIDRAVEQAAGLDEDTKKGIELISQQIKSVLDSLKVTSVGVAGESFDPNLHDAVSHINDDKLADNVISEVFQIGYRINDKIIRHAMVQVAN